MKIQVATCKNRSQSRGFVLLIVMMLVMMFTGLGLLAMRHSRFEMRSSGAYFDSTQAATLVEAALALAATDLRRSPEYYQLYFGLADYAVDPSGSAETLGNIDIWETRFAIPLNEILFEDITNLPVPCGQCDPDPSAVDGCVELLVCGFQGAGGDSEGEKRFNAEYFTTLMYDAPIVGPCPPGYSCFDEQNYGWYVFGAHATSRYGPVDAHAAEHFVESGRAVGTSRMTIGPIGAYGR